LKPDPAMQSLIDRCAAACCRLGRQARHRADHLLYRRGNFGTIDRLIAQPQRGNFAEIALSPGFRWGVTALAGQPLTMEDVLSETAIAMARPTSTGIGSQLRDARKTSATPFNPDPYYCERRHGPRRRPLTGTPPKRSASAFPISSSNGHAIQAGKHYKVAGWASVNEQAGAPVWDVGKNHLRARAGCRTGSRPGVRLRGVEGKPFGHTGLG
jgi:sulfur-oxidizing protein SoxB